MTPSSSALPSSTSMLIPFPWALLFWLTHNRIAPDFQHEHLTLCLADHQTPRKLSLQSRSSYNCKKQPLSKAHIKHPSEHNYCSLGILMRSSCCITHALHKGFFPPRDLKFFIITSSNSFQPRCVPHAWQLYVLTSAGLYPFWRQGLHTNIVAEPRFGRERCFRSPAVQ